MDQLLTLDDVARLFQITPAQVEQLVLERKLTAYRILDTFRFSPEALQTFLDTHATHAAERAAGRRARNRYQALAELLAQCREDVVTFSFEQLNAELERAGAEPLAASAYRHRAWWANTDTHTHASAWMEMGWRVEVVDLDRRTVAFSRVVPLEGTADRRPLDYAVLRLVADRAAAVAENSAVQRLPDRVEHTMIKVVGVGGAGCSVINHAFASGLRGVDFIAVDTDHSVLQHAQAAAKIAIGEGTAGGLGAGGDPAVGRRAAEEYHDALRAAMHGAEMILLVVGMGGGTGTGAAPVITRTARKLGALTVGVIGKPFRFEGTRRRRIAEEGADALEEQVDVLIAIPNDRILALADRKLTISMAFAQADDIVRQILQAVSDALNVPGPLILDLVDVKRVLSCAGRAQVGIGRAAGDDRAVAAARAAITCPLLTSPLGGARRVLFIVTGDDYTLPEVNDAAQIIQEAVHPDATVTFGATIDESLKGDIQVTLIAAGFEDDPGPTSEPGGGPDLTPRPSPLLPPDVNPPLRAAEQLSTEER
jgi:cell division protein FtsZ